MKLYVGSLPYQTTSEDLAELFGQFGEVTEATVIMDRESGRSKGFGFVELPDAQAAQAAMSQLNGSLLGRRTIIVNEANERPPRQGGGSRGGGYGGGRRDQDSGGYGNRERRY